MIETPDQNNISNKKNTENLTFEQRKELMGLMKRMLPPVPSRGIIDIRFSIWFFRYWYLVIIFGKDNRNQFKAMDRGSMDKGLTYIAKAFTYIFILLMMLIVILFMLYLIKSYLGINIYPDKHLIDVINGMLRR